MGKSRMLVCELYYSDVREIVKRCRSIECTVSALELVHVCLCDVAILKSVVLGLAPRCWYTRSRIA